MPDSKYVMRAPKIAPSYPGKTFKASLKKVPSLSSYPGQVTSPTSARSGVPAKSRKARYI